MIVRKDCVDFKERLAEALSSSLPSNEIARRFGVSPANVRRYRTRLWKGPLHVNAVDRK